MTDEQERNLWNYVAEQYMDSLENQLGATPLDVFDNRDGSQFGLESDEDWMTAENLYTEFCMQLKQKILEMRR